MANYKARISWTSHDGPEPEIEIDLSQWQKIEDVLDATISEENRTQLIYICNTYLGLKNAEISVARESEVRAHAKATLKLLDGFIHFCNGSYPGHKISNTDAYVEFEHRFEQTLSQHALTVRTERLFPVEAAPEDVAEYLASKPLVLSLQPYDLMNIAHSISVALDRIGQGKHATDEAGQLRGFKPGEAFVRFIGRCRAWAQGMGLPHGGYDADGEPSKLAAAVFEIAALMPNELNPNIKSIAAMAKHIKLNPILK